MIFRKRKKSPVSVSGLLYQNLSRMLRRQKPQFEQVQLPHLSEDLIKNRRSIFIRHLDCGSCNACELELNALENPVYDIEQYGIRFEPSPRHADILAMTGPFTRNLEEAALLTLEAMPEPRIITIGDCAQDGGIFKTSYALTEKPAPIRQAIVFHVPGCPPSPEAILAGLADWLKP